MTSGSRFLLTAGMFLAVLGGISVAQPKWMADLGLDWGNLPGLFRETVAAEKKLADLESRDELVRERIRQKDQIVDELLAGRIDLKAACAEFQSLNQGDPSFDREFDTFPGSSREEKSARHVINWVRVRVAVYPQSAAEGLEERLEKELEEILAGTTVRSAEQSGASSRHRASENPN